LSDHGGKVAAVALQPPQAPGWSSLSASVGWDWRPHIIGTDGSLYAFYTGEGSAPGASPAGPVGLYLGVYRTQRQGAELVNYANVMVAEKDPEWSNTLMRPRRVRLESGDLALTQYLLASRHGERLLVWSWYLVGNRHTANPFLAKLLEAKSRLVGRHGEAVLIAVATPYDEKPEVAAAVLTAFLNAMLPAIEAEAERSLRAEP
jgi:EpsI family protein